MNHIIFRFILADLFIVGVVIIAMSFFDGTAEINQNFNNNDFLFDDTLTDSFDIFNSHSTDPFSDPVASPYDSIFSNDNDNAYNDIEHNNICFSPQTSIGPRVFQSSNHHIGYIQNQINSQQNRNNNKQKQNNRIDSIREQQQNSDSNNGQQQYISNNNNRIKSEIIANDNNIIHVYDLQNIYTLDDNSGFDSRGTICIDIEPEDADSVNLEGIHMPTLENNLDETEENNNENDNGSSDDGSSSSEISLVARELHDESKMPEPARPLHHEPSNNAIFSNANEESLIDLNDSNDDINDNESNADNNDNGHDNIYASNSERDRGVQYGKWNKFRSQLPYENIMTNVQRDECNYCYIFRTDDGVAQGVVWLKSRQSYITRFQTVFGDPQIEVCTINKPDVADLFFIEKHEDNFVKWQNTFFTDNVKWNILSAEVKILHINDLVMTGQASNWLDIVQRFPAWSGSNKLQTSFKTVYDLKLRQEKKKADVQKYSGLILRPWQQQEYAIIKSDIENPSQISDRDIIFYVDKLGDGGKSVFTGYVEAMHPRDVLVIDGLSEVKNLAELLRYKRDIKMIFVDLPRSAALQPYMDCMSFFESVKNRRITLMKYRCISIGLSNNVGVYISMNEYPSPHWFSRDRYKCKELIKNQAGIYEIHPYAMNFENPQQN